MNHACNTPEHTVSRRQVLGSLAGGAIGSAGLGCLLEPAVAAEIKKQQKQVLFIWLDGGMSQLETWDPKPGTEFGGPFRSISTRLPGVRFGELVPATAAIADKLTLIRCMSTKDENHSTGVPRIQRGDPKNRGVIYPFLGSAVTKLIGAPDNSLPPYMHIKPGRGGFMWKDAGFLGPRFGALGLGDGAQGDGNNFRRQYKIGTDSTGNLALLSRHHIDLAVIQRLYRLPVLGFNVVQKAVRELFCPFVTEKGTAQHQYRRDSPRRDGADQQRRRHQNQLVAQRALGDSPHHRQLALSAYPGDLLGVQRQIVPQYPCGLFRRNLGHNRHVIKH